MNLTNLFALLQETAPATAADGSQNMVKIVSGVLALVLVAIIIMRRKSSAKKNEDEF